MRGAMSNEQARTLFCALVHDGIDPGKLSEKARQEIRTAFELILKMVAESAPEVSETSGIREP